jgi:hypothetical protein
MNSAIGNSSASAARLARHAGKLCHQGTFLHEIDTISAEQWKISNNTRDAFFCFDARSAWDYINGVFGSVCKLAPTQNTAVASHTGKTGKETLTQVKYTE